jgi:geranylgeranylglycerol-phosphate geranylgeranyltransferase
MSDVEERPSETPDIFSYMWRGVQYASISACTILAGYFMQPQKTLTNDLLLLSIPILATVYFFIRYANRFHPSDSSIAPGDIIGTAFRTEAVRLYFFLILIPYSLFVLYVVSRSDELSYRLLLALVIYLGLIIYYSRFLITYKSEGKLPLVRHWLIWPVILTIALGLYYGLSFSVMKESLLPLIPVGIIIFLYIVSQTLKLSRRLYLSIMLLVSLAVTTLSFLNQIGYLLLPENLNLSLILFCVAASSYLAVFEAGRITADIAKAEHDGGETPSPINKSFRYAQATLAALTVTVSVLPFYYIFSSYGSLFLIGFAIHAFASFIIWFYFGETPYLHNWPRLPKIIAGVSFLGLLVLSPTDFFSQQFTFRFMKGFAGWVGVAFLLFFVGLLVGRVIKDFDKLRDEGSPSPVLLCFVFCIIITGLLSSLEESSRQYLRAELAFQVYAFCIFVCLIIEAVEHIRKNPRISQSIESIIGLLLVLRIFTSLMITLVIFLPLLYSGVSVTRALISALPFFCAAAGGFAINDYYDELKDAINKPYRAIPSGRMKPHWALVIGLLLIVSAIVFSLISYNSNFELFLYLTSVVGVITYNFFVKHFAISKTVLTAAVSTLPLVYVVTTLDYPSIYLMIPLGAMLFLVGRELLMDIRDIKGDSVSGITTLPMVIGTELTAKVGFLLLISCGIILLCFTFRAWSIQNLSLTCLILVSSLLVSFYWSYKAGRYQRAIIISLYLPMLCGIFLLLK